MTNIDYALIVGVVLLLLIVAIRIVIGRRRKAEGVSAPGIKLSHSAAGQSLSETESPENFTATVKPEKIVEKASTEKAVNREKSREATPVAADAVSEPATFNEILDPITLIKTFSAPAGQRINAIREAGLHCMIEAVPALIEALYEPDQNISLAATESLGEIGDPRAIEPLIEISRRSDAALMRAISADSEKREKPESEKPVEEVADANPYKFKEMVVFKIDQLPVEYFQPDGTPLPRKELVVRGLKDNSQQMRQMAAKAAIGLDSEDVVDPLIEALGNPFEVESVRFMAAEALGGMQNDKSVDSLLKALKDENVAVRYSAAAALSGRKDEKILEALIEATDDADKFVRASVAYALGTTGEPEALKALFKCVADENEVVRFSAAKAIAGFPSDDVLALLDLFSGTNEREGLLVRVEVLGQMKAGKALKALKELLKNPDSEVSYKASMALMGHENTDIFEELIAASKRLDDELRQLAKKDANLAGLLRSMEQSYGSQEGQSAQVSVTALTDIKNLPPNLEKLRKGLLDSSPNIRGSAANTLGDFQSADAVMLLAAAAKDDNEYVRSSAVNSLGRIGNKDAFELVIKYEKDSSEEVRYAVVKALSACKDEAGQGCLNRIAKNDKSKNVKRAARLALEKLNS